MFLYPFGDFHSLNLGWFLLQFKDWTEKIQEYLDNGGGTSENLANVIAPVFNAANTYSAGDYVLYNNELYKANQAVNPGTWDPDAWSQCLIVDEMGTGGGSAGVDNVARLMIAGQYSASFAYQKYGICRYNDKLWMCNTDLPAGGEAWNPTHWDEITVGAGLSGLRRSVDTLSSSIVNIENSLNRKTTYLAFTDMEGLTQSDLLSSLNTNNASIPNGTSIIKFGSTTNAGKVTVICNKTNNTIGRAFSVSSYTSCNNLDLRLSSNGWTEAASYNKSVFPSLDNKKIVIYGDSMSDETSPTVASLQPNWVTKVRNTLVGATITNKALAGAKISGAAPSINSIVNAETEIDADIIILFAGTNDWRHSADLGSFGAATPDITTFCGALDSIKNKFVSLAPDADVFIITPPKIEDSDPPSDHTNLRPLAVYRNALATFAAQNGYNLIDGYAFPLLNPFNSTLKTRFQSDGIHQLPAYAPILANYILDKLSSGGDNGLAPNMTRVNIAELANTGVTLSFAYADFDNLGKITITMSGHFTATENNNQTIMTLPEHMRPLTSGIVVMQSQIGNSFYAEYCTFNTSGTVVTKRSPASGEQYFAIMVEYNTKFNGFNANAT